MTVGRHGALALQGFPHTQRKETSMMNKTDEKGFTLIELMIVIAIIGILAAIAIPNFLSYRRRSYNSAANSDVKNAYTSAQAYFTDRPTGSVSGVAILTAYGFRQTANVDVAPSGTQSTLQIITYHGSGDRTFTSDEAGTITNN
jgi:prepilin-type N-terminal cleavage/methylation domain-containing protein